MKRVSLLLSAILLVAGLAWAQSAGAPDNVAEAARKARAAREKKGAAKPRVYTNENIPGTPGVSVVGTTAAPAAAAPTEGQAAAGGAAPGEAAAGESAEECDEPCWRGKFREQRTKIRTAERELDILQREYNLSRTQYYQDPNQAVREQYSNNVAGGRELQDLLTRINDKKAEIQKLQQELRQLEDDLRRAGGKPGWAREE